MEKEESQLEMQTVETPKTASQRITDLSKDIDFGLPPEQDIDYVMKDYTMNLSPERARDMVRNSGIQSSFGEQVATGVENVVASLSMLPDQASIAYGNLTNYFSDGKIGEELQNAAFDSLQKRMADIGYNEEAIGGVNNWLAQLVTGGASFMELALVSMATGGVGGLAQIVTQEMGEGFYNDMQAYLDVHGSLDGYKPKGSDVALNIANTILQAGIEAWQGVASPRFLTGWSRGLWKEGVAGFGQEFAQGALSDFNEFLKGNIEAQDLMEQSDQWIRDGIVGGVLQGTLGAATYGTARRKHDMLVARAHAMSKGRKEPNKEDMDIAKKLGNLKEQGYGSAFAEEFKKRFDATSPVGQLQQKIATAINDAYKAGKIDFGGASETQIAQKIESFAAQETLNAMEDSAERKQSIGEHELNSIVFKGAEGAKEGELWLAGLEPEVGERSVDLAKVLEYRQSGLAEINAELEVLDGEIKQLRKQLTETTVDVKEAQKELLKEQIKKKEGQAESKRLKKSQLEASNARLYASIEKMSAPKAEKTSEKIIKQTQEQVSEQVAPQATPQATPQETPQEVQTVVPVEDVQGKKSLKEERKQEKKTKKINKTQAETTWKLKGDSKYVKVIDKPDVDFTDAKEYVEQPSRYLLNKVLIKEQNGNLYFKMSGQRWLKQTYLVIENYRNTDPFEIYSAQIEEGTELGDHFDRAVQDFYEEKGLWSLAQPITLRSWEEFTKDLPKQETSQETTKTQQPSEPDVITDESQIEPYDPNKKYEKYDVAMTRTNSGMHYGVWDGDVMLLKDSLEEVNEFIKRDRELEAKNEQSRLESEQKKKEQHEKMVNAFLGDVPYVATPMSYIIEELKNRGMWDGLHLRTKGNMNAFESIILQNGEITGARGNSNAKKGTKVSQSTIDVIQELRRALKTERGLLFQSRPDQSRLDKGDTYRGAYDEKLKRIILNEKSDLTTIQHEFAHYWIQNNFRWYRSGLASDDWKRNWERVEQALGIEPTDKYLSKVASEKFARAYERYIMEGKVTPEYQWAFEEFKDFYNETYEDLKAEYFDLEEELSPDLVDWFNRQKPVAPEQVAEMRQNVIRQQLAAQPDQTAVEQLGDSYVVSTVGDNGEIQTEVVMSQENAPKDDIAVMSDKKTQSGLQKSLKEKVGGDIDVDNLAVLDTAETFAKAEELVATNPQKAWDMMLSDNSSDITRAYLYKAFARLAENDPQIAVDLANTNMAQWAREKGQAIQALNLQDDLGLSPQTILSYMQKAKGKMSQEELSQALNEIDLSAGLSEQDATTLENEVECLI